MRDIDKLRFAIIYHTLEDLSWFNRNGVREGGFTVGSEREKKYCYRLTKYYNPAYYMEICKDMRSGWFWELCKKYGIGRDVVEDLIANYKQHHALNGRDVCLFDKDIDRYMRCFKQM